MINLIAEFRLVTERLYHSGFGSGEATYFETTGRVGFGNTFFKKGRGLQDRIGTVIHEFSHAIWTGPDGRFSNMGSRDISTYFKFESSNARRIRDKALRQELLGNAYLFERTVLGDTR